ncbi:MAG: hypothetical protein ACK4P4_09180 [Allorhizobium sp.]
MKISEGHTYIDMAGRRVYVVGRQKFNGGKLWLYTGYQVDREGRQISEPRGWKSDGSDWVGDMMGRIIREASIGMKLTEAQDIILERLIEAIDTDLALPVRVGPKMFGNAMPDVVVTPGEVFALELVEQIQDGGVGTRQRHQAINHQTERKAKCSRARITRMEEAFTWLSRIFDEEDRRVLLAYAEVKARGWDWGRYIENRNRRSPNKDAWVKRTIFRKITKTLQEVETKLRKDAIILRDGAGLQVAQRAA